MNTLYKIALSLSIIGSINWGLVGLFNINLVTLIFGVDTLLTSIIYTLVCIGGLISIGILFLDLDDRKTNH